MRQEKVDVRLKQKRVGEGEDLGDTNVKANGARLTDGTEYFVKLFDDDADLCAGT